MRRRSAVRFFEHSLSIIFDFLNSINSNNITTSQDEKAFNDSCEQINILKNKYNDFNSLNQLQTKLEPINPIILKMRKKTLLIKLQNQMI